ncbi:MAG: pyruvate dehydrogenase [Planctomycetes bacterium]|nr:pyruvate dehydrogenase [Planctomycetota bacterium]
MPDATVPTAPPVATAPTTPPALDLTVLARIAERALVLAVRSIYDANRRADKAEGDPKVGGHPAACSSALHILTALHLAVRRSEDFCGGKPHAAPVDHALHYLLGLFRAPAGAWLPEPAARAVLGRLRAFPRPGSDERVLQSYHAESDPDSQNLLPTGSVGIPPVIGAYTALALRYAADHGLYAPVSTPAPAGGGPPPHVWCLIGDSEFREGSLLEALPDAAERELGNLTWILDYNRQSLDGARTPNFRALRGTDADRIARTAEANGWRVLQVRHGPRRRAAFAREGGGRLRAVLETRLSDFELQMLLLRRDGAATRRRLLAHDPELEPVLRKIPDDELQALLADLGGHDLGALIEALTAAKADPRRPAFVIAHTIKGWGLDSYAAHGNHSALPAPAEMRRLTEAAGLTDAEPYGTVPSETAEGRFLAARGEALRAGLDRARARRDAGLAAVRARIAAAGGLPETLAVNLKLAPWAHTQWAWGQVAAKLVRLGERTDGARPRGPAPSRELSADDRRWSAVAEYVLTLAPDVGTSTNLNPVMDDKIYGPSPKDDWDDALAVRDPKRPDVSPTEGGGTRHLRFEITEANCVCAAGAFGKLGDLVGVPLLPIMTVYDFFVKRALDQLFYDLYWGASFICIGTPAGVTLSPEGAQHCWKSDFQLPNLVTWEPCFAVEVPWILADAVRRHLLRENRGRTGVLVRCVTRALRQGVLLERLRRAARFKSGLAPGVRLSAEATPRRPGSIPESAVPAQADAEILSALRPDALAGAYWLVDWRGYEAYAPGDNVVHLVALGNLATEAVAASDALLAEGIYANVLVVTSHDLLAGHLAAADGERHLHTLFAAARAPLVSVADGEPGLLDNLGGLLGVRQEALGLRRFSKCGRPAEVYAYHRIDAAEVRAAAWRVLESAAQDRGAERSMAE